MVLNMSYYFQSHHFGIYKFYYINAVNRVTPKTIVLLVIIWYDKFKVIRSEILYSTMSVTSHFVYSREIRFDF